MAHIGDHEILELNQELKRISEEDTGKKATQMPFGVKPGSRSHFFQKVLHILAVVKMAGRFFSSANTSSIKEIQLVLDLQLLI